MVVVCNKFECDAVGFDGDMELDRLVESTTDEISIGWRNLRFETNGWFGRTRKKVILNRLNGCFEYHTLNGFMGPSGAGKTTLLNCLSGNRVQCLTEDSEIFLNKDMQDGKVVSYFIEQHVEKTMVGKMRVGQILRYAYRFKNGGEGDMERHIRTIINELLLDEKVLDRKFEQCSGGEQKRIAIAQELMSLRKPTLLFVDEPTTGLDSNAAHLLMKCMKQLATNHRMTVVTSIHVPSDDILNLFDKLYVLAKGGVCIYSGRPQQLRTYLKTEIPDLVIPNEQPPIEVLTEIACTGLSDSRVITISNHTLSTEYLNLTCHLPKLRHHQNGVPNHRKPFSFVDLFHQFSRMFRIVLVANFPNILLQLCVGFVYLLFISNLFDRNMAKPSGCYSLIISNLNDDNDEMEYENTTTTNITTTSVSCTNQIVNDSLIRKNVYYLGNVALFVVFVVVCIGSVFSAPFIHMFRNEHRNHWYSLGTFFWSATIVGLLQALLYAIPFAACGYFLSGQHLYVDAESLNWTQLFHFLFYFFILAIYFVSLGQLIGTVLCDNLELALVASSFVSVTFSTYSGYLIDVESSQNPLLLFTKDMLQIDSILKGIVYTLYDRCNLDREYSLTLDNFHVKRTDYLGSIWYTVQAILINAALIRLTTLAYMYWQFNLAGRRSKKKKDLEIDMKTIDYETNNNHNKVPKDNDKRILITKKAKSMKEIEFEKFSRGKILMAWRNLSLFGTSFIFEQTDSNLKDVSDEKTILRNLNGEIRFGTLNALMGTSGSGKTSLLKVLNGRDKTRLSGTTQFYLSKFTRIQTCFITQDVSGHLLPGLTAKQTLVYASKLKNAQLRECAVDTSQIDHQQIALNLLDELSLSETVDTLVEKCSGGERKRLALALELTALQMPNLICIDEPTSGLDSNSAKVVVSCLRKLTQTHSITIVASIHQPNTELLRMFDQIYVLARGGVCIYSGAPTEILPHLQTVPELSSLSVTKFPIETLIKLSCCSYPDDPIVHHLMSTNDLQFVKTTDLLEQQTQQVPDGIQQNRRRFSLEDTWILCQRYFSYIHGYLWKELLAFLVIIVGFAFFIANLFDRSIANFAGCLNLEDDFNNSCSKTSTKIEEDNMLAFNLQYNVLAFGLFFVFVLIQSIVSFLRESAIFFNEHHNGWYSSGSFYLSKSLLETLPIVILLMAYVYICNLYQSIIPGIYPNLIVVMCLTTLAYQGFAHFACLISGGDLQLTTLVAISIFMLNVMLTNFSVTIARCHYLYRLLASFSITGHLLDATVLLVYGFGRCLPKQIQPILYLFSLEDSDYYRCLMWLVFIALLYHTMSLALLVYHGNPNQNRRNQIANINEQVTKFEPTNTIIPGIGSPMEFRIKIVRF